VVCSPDVEPAPTWNVTPPRFRAQLAGLLERGYRPMRLRELLAASATGQPLPPRAFAVTFDDGYQCVHAHAWPILRELGVPATVFLTTAYLDRDGPFPFDDWRWAGSDRVAAVTWRPLSTLQCQEMLADGLIEFGSHTHTHAVFRDRPAAMQDDVAASLAVLRERLGVTDATFAFPFGIAGPALADAVRRAGVRCALTTQPTLIEPGSDPFSWGRFGISEADSAGTIAGKLDGWYGIARAAWLQVASGRVAQ
jgi:peptidoglycan/xylan/chitin deacetylase (PgdA/CDA1 family)